MNQDLKTVLRQRGPIKKIGVLGMGYVGVPAAIVFAACPVFDFVWGFQRDSASSGYKIGLLNSGESPFSLSEPSLNPLLSQVVRARRFRCTSDFSKISEVDAITIAVETGFLDPERMIDDSNP